MAKVLYEPSYESAIWRIYFMNNWQLTFKNFYVTFEWIISELDDEKKELYDEISSLVNWIEDLSVENTDLKSSLDRLRKNLNNYKETTEIVVTIKNQISDWWITLTSKQNDVLNDIIARLENKDTVITVWMNEYEKNKQEIMSLLSESGISQKTKSNAQEWFNEFEEILAAWLEPEEKERMLNEIRDDILSDLKKDKQQDLYWENFKIYFCNMFDYYSIISSKCWSQENNLITENYEKSQKQDTPSKSWWLPLWLKIILIILVWWLLTMWWIIVFFSVKARMNSMSENDEEE
jgi:regulator of replication initiation timing